MSIAAPAPRVTVAVDSATERLQAYMEAYWLRPENAIWMALRSQALDAAPWHGACVDVCCGDGIFTYLHLGGRFEPTFDVFSSVGRLDEVTEQHADMFDHDQGEYDPPCTSAPRKKVQIGLDLKPNLLWKAGALGLYERLVRHDSNAPLPLSAASVQTLYCNAAYWVREIDALLSEMRRVVSPGGAVILHVKLADMRRFTLNSMRRTLGSRFLEIIGRSRISCWPSLFPQREWERRFRRAGLTVDSVRTIATKTHAHLWDVGLRPLAPLLVRMAQGLKPETRAAVKRDWVALAMELSLPLCRGDLALTADGGAPAELQYVLRV